MAIEGAPSYAELQQRLVHAERELAEARERETEARKREAEGLARETATGQILRVIAGSPIELQPVLEAVAHNAALVCGADDAHIRLLHGDALRLAATFGDIPGPGPGDDLPLDRGSVAGRALIDRKTVHVRDMFEESDEEYAKALSRRFSLRTILGVPMLREGLPIGTIVIRRQEDLPFTAQQIALST